MASNKLYSGLYKLLSGFFRRVYRVRLDGAENEPENGPFIVCVNHLSIQDVFITACCMKHQLRFLAKAELFKIPILRGLITALGAIPVERGKGDVGAIKRSVSLLQSGEVVAIYPQGHRYPGVDPSETEPKGGVGLVVSRAKVKVLPVCIQAKGFKLRPFRKTYVTFGKPIEFEQLGMTDTGKSEYDRVSRQIFGEICAMVRKDV